MPARARKTPKKKTTRRRPATRAESPAARATRAGRLIRALRDLYPDSDCALHHASALELLVATILSAQCTDERVNMVTPDLFSRWPDAAHLSRATQEDVEAVVRSTGFYRNKAKNLIGMSRGLVERHDGEVPADIDALVALPGVARKTGRDPWPPLSGDVG